MLPCRTMVAATSLRSASSAIAAAACSWAVGELDPGSSMATSGSTPPERAMADCVSAFWYASNASAAAASSRVFMASSVSIRMSGVTPPSARTMVWFTSLMDKLKDQRA